MQTRRKLDALCNILGFKDYRDYGGDTLGLGFGQFYSSKNPDSIVNKLKDLKNDFRSLSLKSIGPSDEFLLLLEYFGLELQTNSRKLVKKKKSK